MHTARPVPLRYAEAPKGPAVDLIRRNPPARTPDSPPLTRVLTPKGLYELRDDPAATYVALTKEEDRRPASAGRTVYVASDNNHVNEGYYPKIPKAPTELLSEIVSIFERTGQVEAHINLVYDRLREEYGLYSTEISGTATAGKVSYRHVPNTPDHFVVAEFHSHHHMGAFFSSLDDDAEQRSGVYGVIGRTDLIHTDSPRPHLALRYSCGGMFRPLSADAVFDSRVGVDLIVEEVTLIWPGRNL